MRLPELRRVLLSLIGPRPDTQSAALLGEREWRLVSDMAAQHRLQPYLHARLEREELTIALPATIRDAWRAAHRASGIDALVKRKVLLETDRLLTAHGIRAVALKGAWVAWHGYRAPAERPMRDIDLLVAKEQALAAFHLLLADGYRQEEAAARTPRESIEHDKHLPPLLAPDGTRLELHVRLWERSTAIGRPMPPDDSAAMLARAGSLGDDPVAYLSPDDRLVHGVIHGAYSNRLDGGPLTLIDLATMVEQGGIDWSAFWTRAANGGWLRGAVLLFQLTERYCSEGLAGKTQCPAEVEAEVLAGAPELLLQDLGARKAVGLVAALSGKIRHGDTVGAFGTAFQRLRGRDRAIRPGDTEQAPLESFGRWAWRRSGETAKALADPDVRGAAREAARLGEWLDGKR